MGKNNEALYQGMTMQDLLSRITDNEDYGFRKLEKIVGRRFKNTKSKRNGVVTSRPEYHAATETSKESIKFNVLMDLTNEEIAAGKDGRTSISIPMKYLRDPEMEYNPVDSKTFYFALFLEDSNDRIPLFDYIDSKDVYETCKKYYGKVIRSRKAKSNNNENEEEAED